MTRKKSPFKSGAMLVKRPEGSANKAPTDAPTTRRKVSLQDLLADTPENSRDEAWEKMASVGREF